MARVNHTATQLVVTGYPTLPLTANAADIPFAAADATNFEEVDWAANLIIIARNTGAGARTVTVTSATDSHGRSGDITAYSMDAGEVAVLGPFPSNGWRQSNGKLYHAASHAEVLFAYVLVPTVT